MISKRKINDMKKKIIQGIKRIGSYFANYPFNLVFFVWNIVMILALIRVWDFTNYRIFLGILNITIIVVVLIVGTILIFTRDIKEIIEENLIIFIAVTASIIASFTLSVIFIKEEYIVSTKIAAYFNMSSNLWEIIVAVLLSFGITTVVYIVYKTILKILRVSYFYYAFNNETRFKIERFVIITSIFSLITGTIIVTPFFQIIRELDYFANYIIVFYTLTFIFVLGILAISSSVTFLLSKSETYRERTRRQKNGLKYGNYNKDIQTNSASLDEKDKADKSNVSITTNSVIDRPFLPSNIETTASAQNGFFDERNKRRSSPKYSFKTKGSSRVKGTNISKDESSITTSNVERIKEKEIVYQAIPAKKVGDSCTTTGVLQNMEQKTPVSSRPISKQITSPPINTTKEGKRTNPAPLIPVEWHEEKTKALDELRKERGYRGIFTKKGGNNND